MEEKKDTLEQQIAKAKIKIICAGIEEAILLILELYLMINTEGHFIAMVFGVLFMIVGIFFLVSGILDVTLYNKEIDTQKYEDIYNAQKASYMVIRKSFDEMDERLRVIEMNSQLPAEEIITAQKAVAKVTISRNKENTDALMNSNDELISQLLSIKDQLAGSNSAIMDSQQKILEETKKDLQRRIAKLTNQIANIELKIQSGAVMAAPASYIPPTPAASVDDFDDSFDMDESIDALSDLDVSASSSDISEPVAEAIPEPLAEVIPEPVAEAIPEPVAEEIPEPVAEAIPEPVAEAIPEPVAEVTPEPVAEATPEPVAEEIPEPVAEVIPEPVAEVIPEPVAEVIPEPVAEAIPEPEPEAIPEPETVQAVEIPDVGIDLSDPNRVMSPEEIEKLFASI